MPAEPGAKAQATSDGFTITRQGWRIESGKAPEKIEVRDGVLQVKQGGLIEETAEVVNPEDRTHIAISIARRRLRPYLISFWRLPAQPRCADAAAELGRLWR
jgi:hypothetical protein